MRSNLARRLAVALTIAAAGTVYASAANAWLLPEHTHIGRTALAPPPSPPPGKPTARSEVMAVETETLATLREAWALVLESEPASKGASVRLCKDVSMPESPWLFQSPDATAADRCIDFPMLVAIAGDFSCSPEDLWAVATRSTWLPDILENSQQTEKALLAPGATNESKLDAWHADHIGNFNKDEDYLTRAKGNLGHFAWPRETDRLGDYLEDALTANRPANAHAFYIVYHAAALRLAHRARTLADPARHRDAIRRAMLSEAFALHFLEDSFSAGHIAGRSGGARVRTGTHDYYCESGLEGALWPEGRGELCDQKTSCDTYLAHGDAFMEDEDRRHAAIAVQRSLHDLAHTLRWDSPERAWLFAPELDFLEKSGADSMNACKDLTAVPAHFQGAAQDEDLRYTLRVTIQPTRSNGRVDPAEGEPGSTLPTFATEMGGFLGAFASARAVGGVDLQSTPRHFQLLGRMDVGFETGIGLAGITTAETDGLAWLQLGTAIDSPAVFSETTASHPGRFGLSVRVHAPFAAVPLLEHLFYTLPAWFTCNLKARSWLIRGAERGLFGLARVRNTSIGNVQLVLGREFGFRYVVGSNGSSNAFGFDWPIVEYKPRQWYSGSVGNVFSLQLGASLDVEESRAGTLGLFLRAGTSIRRYRYP